MVAEARIIFAGEGGGTSAEVGFAGVGGHRVKGSKILKSMYGSEDEWLWQLRKEDVTCVDLGDAQTRARLRIPTSTGLRRCGSRASLLLMDLRLDKIPIFFARTTDNEELGLNCGHAGDEKSDGQGVTTEHVRGR